MPKTYFSKYGVPFLGNLDIFQTKIMCFLNFYGNLLYLYFLIFLYYDIFIFSFLSIIFGSNLATYLTINLWTKAKQTLVQYFKYESFLTFHSLYKHKLHFVLLKIFCGKMLL